MKNSIQSGHTITVARASISESGKLYDLGSGLAGVALGDYAANESGEYALSGVVELDKRSADVYAIGDTVDYDDANEETVTDADAAGDFEAGVVVEAAGAGVLKAKVMINKNPGPGPSYS